MLALLVDAPMPQVEFGTTVGVCFLMVVNSRYK